MSNVTAVTLIKEMSYRGDATEEWSNKYYLTGAAPATPTDWKTLFDALIAGEKHCYSPDSQVIRAYGYDQLDTDTSPVAVASFDYLAASAAVPGDLSSTGGAKIAGDQAGVISWKTSRLNFKGKPIYLRKYMHSIFASSTGADNVSSATFTALAAFATLMQTTGLLGATHFLRSRLHTETFLSHRVDPFVTTRTLKRRGRRP